MEFISIYSHLGQPSGKRGKTTTKGIWRCLERGVDNLTEVLCLSEGFKI